MEEFDFQSNWLEMSTPPQSGIRCLVTDGYVIYIATYILETDGKQVWIFSGMTEEEAKNFKVHRWMELPKLLQIEPVVVNNINKEKNEK